MKGFRERFHEDVVERYAQSEEQRDQREAKFRYRHLSLDERRLVDAVLHGTHPLDKMPRPRSRVVRIFISSTFTDMCEERNAVMGTVIPRLRAYCKERFGVEFQVADMRWGIQNQAKDDHSGTDLCIDEVHHCQSQSIGPNFVVFLGQKYGQFLLPSTIEMARYEPIRARLRELSSQEDMEFLERWYWKDSNSSPAKYRLQSISSVLGSDVGQWPDVEDKLQAMLRRGAEVCVQQGDLDQSVLDRLHNSVTEVEVQEGILKHGSPEADVKHNCLLFLREIDDLHEYLDRNKAYRFVDLKPNTMEVCSESSTRLNELKNKVLSAINDENVHRDAISWEDPCGVDPVKHAQYIERFCNTFFAQVQRMVHINVEKQHRLAADEVYEEVTQHWNTAAERCDAFMGRQSVLNDTKIFDLIYNMNTPMFLVDIHKYLTSVTDKALVLLGESGIGKTSIMAKAASMAHEWLAAEGKNIQTTVILRFCGSTPGSSTIRQLLKGLCHQIAYAAGLYRHEIPDDYKDVKKYFTNLISQGEFGGLVVIILDAVDQLSSADDAFRMDWLPAKISNNVKVILSTLSSEVDILNRLHSKITDDSHFIEIGTLEPRKCLDIVLYWLNQNNRLVAPPQWDLMKKAFQNCSSPLYMKLAFEEVCLWKSYTSVDTVTLAPTIEDCIDSLFDRMEVKHGYTLFSHTLAYITASKNGISEAELEDVLSLDDQVLNSVFEYWEPPIRRIPPNVVSRVIFDLRNYFVYRATDDTDVLAWYHRQFTEVAMRRYLCDADRLNYIHVILADYFLGTWSRMKKKPFAYEDKLMWRLNIKDKNSAAVRHVPEQPLVFTTFNTEERFNFRKLSQMPYHLAKAGLIDKLKEQVLFNYQWLHTKLRACTVHRVITDFYFVKSRDIQLVADALLTAESALAADPNVLGPEITGRLLPHAQNYPSIWNLIRQCDLAAQRNCPLIPLWQMYTSPGGPLQYECEIEREGNAGLDVDIIQGEESLYIYSKPFNSPYMRVWDVTSGECKPDMLLSAASAVHPTLSGRFINVIKNNKYLQTYRVDSRELYGEVLFGHSNISEVVVANRYVAILFVESPGPAIIDIEAGSLLHRMHYQADACAISPDDKFMLCNFGHCIVLHAFPLMERKSILQCSDLPQKLQFIGNTPSYIVLFRGKMIQRVDINLINRKAKPKGIISDMAIKDFKISYNQESLLVRAARCLYVFHLKTSKRKFEIRKMPGDVFTEKLSVFQEACFTPKDALIVAARYTYLGVWDANTGQPLRLLHSSVSPVDKLFSSPVVNKVITLREDTTLQVWNLDNLDADVQHCNAVVRGSVRSLSSSCMGSRMITAGDLSGEAKVTNINTGDIEWNLVHTVDDSITEVLISPKGRIGVTRTPNFDVPKNDKSWDVLHEDKYWCLDTGMELYELTRCNYVVFDPTDQNLVTFRSKFYSVYDWLMVSYQCVMYNISCRETTTLNVPCGHVVGIPVITAAGNYLAFILQKCHRKMDAAMNEKSRTYELQLHLFSFQGHWREWKAMNLCQVWDGAKADDAFLGLQTVSEDYILIVYAKNMDHYDITCDGKVDRSKPCLKRALMYDIHNDCLLQRFDNFLLPDVPLDALVITRCGTLVLDDSLRIHDVMKDTILHDVSFLREVALVKTIQFILNGKYLIMLSKSRRDVDIYRVGERTRLSRCFVHGTASILQVGSDDRTVFVGCDDGRVMTMMAVLDTPDPLKEYIVYLSSRRQPSPGQKVIAPVCAALERDVEHVTNDLHDLRRLSFETQRLAVIERKIPSFRAVETVVSVAQEHNRSGSRACAIM